MTFGIESGLSDGFGEDGFRDSEIREGPDGHVSADSGEAVEKEDTHAGNLSCAPVGSKGECGGSIPDPVNRA